ncbi:hypothetical protein Pcinc_022409 [Petrolisthes cinctipes]|uniref:Beta-1,4-N-acetylgalactosaminyltransferase n=1 Tax=Petrolisthes cinctipes TaxID=88211 RepID=A0AAE1KGT2_PETCI|nr:hypothetical protein Pcinc_022409 [Petrolisthes cinctipes]
MVEPVKSLNINVGKVWLMSGLLSLTLWHLPLLLGKYVDVTFPYIAQEDIVRELVGVAAVDTGNKKDLCPALSPHLQDSPHLMSNDIVALAEEVVARDNQVQPGGIWEPKDCKARYRLVLIVPYRNRSDHLQQFLTYMHPFLQRQQLSYRIVVVEQSKEKSFNRAKLFNIGFVESQKVAKEVECFIFHDVDLLPRHDHNIYSCTHNPRHMYSAVDVFRYHLPYREIMGGVVALQRSHIVAMNGFSNRFYGWGAEDDDLAQRIHQKGFTLTRFDPAVASYVTLSHQSETPAQDRFITLSQAKENMKKDGLNSLNYEVKEKEERSLYTWLLVSC